MEIANPNNLVDKLWKDTFSKLDTYTLVDVKNVVFTFHGDEEVSGAKENIMKKS